MCFFVCCWLVKVWKVCCFWCIVCWYFWGCIVCGWRRVCSWFGDLIVLVVVCLRFVCCLLVIVCLWILWLLWCCLGCWWCWFCCLLLLCRLVWCGLCCCVVSLGYVVYFVLLGWFVFWDWGWVGCFSGLVFLGLFCVWLCCRVLLLGLFCCCGGGCVNVLRLIV